MRADGRRRSNAPEAACFPSAKMDTDISVDAVLQWVNGRFGTTTDRRFEQSTSDMPQPRQFFWLSISRKSFPRSLSLPAPFSCTAP